MKKALVCGAGGFIGSHLVERLKQEGYWVRGVDLKYPEFSETLADDFVIGDLRDEKTCTLVTSVRNGFDEVLALAADMGGAGFVFTGENDADIMHNSALINLNIAKTCVGKIGKLFYSSSACVYPKRNQLDSNHPNYVEDSAYPADPDSPYGLEKLCSEKVYTVFYNNYGLDIRIARLHNIFGPKGTWQGGREKAPAALCRKVVLAKDPGEIEIWGPGTQTRSFLYIDECLEGFRRLMNSEYREPLNIGSEEMVTINELANKIIKISGKKISLKHVNGPLGVQGRNSDNRLIRKVLGWAPSATLEDGLKKTYTWILEQIQNENSTS